MNAGELRDPQIAKELRIESELYFLENKGSVSSAAVLWETFKAVLRDRAQKAIAHKNKKERQAMEELENKLRRLGDEPTQSTIHQIGVKRTEYQALAHQEAKLMYLASRHHLYETGDRAGRLLVWLGKKETV